MSSADAKRRSAWLLPVIACAAMLLLPALAWLLVPRPAASRAAPRTEETVEAAPVEPTSPAAPPPRPAPTMPSVASATPDDGAPVTGSVFDPDGHPVAGAFVACDDERIIPATSTDERGRFRLPPEASGCLAVSTHTTFISSDRVRVTAGRDNVLTLNRGGAIEGEVVDDRGAPVAAYALAIESYRGASQDASPLGQVKTIQDARGVFLWDSLPAGVYVLTASAEGRPPARSRSVDVELSRTTRRVRIVLARGATLSGRVVDADTKQPLAGASVGFDGLTSAGMGSGWTRADEAGAYTLEGAPPGPFSIRVAREGYVSKIIPGLVTRGADTLRQDAELRRFVEGGPRDELAGIGAVLAPTPNGVFVGTLTAGGPAESAGMQKGDRILRIDGVDASNMPLADCIQRLRGLDGSIVVVQVDRGGKTVEVTIRRRIVSF